MMLEAIRQFVNAYYIQPIIQDSGYNPVNTLTWALLLVPCLFLTLHILNKLGIAIDKPFIAAVSPYIVVGASLRVMKDAELFSPPLSYVLVTPLIYFLMYFCCLFILALSVNVSRSKRGYNYNMIFGLVGVAWLLVNLMILLRTEEIVSLWVLFAVTGISGIIVLVIYAIGAKLSMNFLTDRLNVAVLAAHLLDAASSHIGIDILGGYSGKHVVEGIIVEHMGSAAGMYPLKLGVLIPALYLLETQFDARERELKNIVLLALIVIGLGPAVRNTLCMILDVFELI